MVALEPTARNAAADAPAAAVARADIEPLDAIQPVYPLDINLGIPALQLPPWH